MPTIAQRLCDEIVEPPQEQSSEKFNEPRTSHVNHNSSKHNGKTTKTVIVEKKKVINKVPLDTVGSRSIINQYKSKEILLKRRLRDVAINTLISGPLRCDNDCITLVRKKDNRICRCSDNNKQNISTTIKETQTLGHKNHSLTADSAKYNENINRSTQYVNSINPGLALQFTSIMTTAKPVTAIKTEDSHAKHRKSSSSRESSGSKITFHNYMGARRWALSKYPSRGPDF